MLLSKKEYKLKIKTEFANHTSYKEKLKLNEVHIIAFAEEGKSVFMANGHLVGNIPSEILRNYCKQADWIYGFVTIYPLLNLSAIARKYFRKDMSESDQLNFEKIIRRIFDLETNLIKSKHIIFDFTCAVKNKEIIKQCIKKVAREIEQKKSNLEVCEIWFDEFEFPE